MPEIIISKREDLTDKVKININGNQKIFERGQRISVNQSELDILLSSHEAPYIMIFEEKKIDDTDCPFRFDPDYRGDETSTGPNSKQR